MTSHAWASTGMRSACGKCGPNDLTTNRREKVNCAECLEVLAVAEPDRKDSNPKDAVGTAKVPVSTVPAQVIAEVGLAMLEGALKYGRHNYRVAGVRASVYYDALRRHVDAWWEGQDTDPDSGLSHITKALAGLVVLRDSMLQGNWTDDRPPKATNLEWVQELNARAAELLKKYPNPKPAFTAKEASREASVLDHAQDQL